MNFLFEKQKKSIIQTVVNKKSDRNVDIIKKSILLF